MRHYFYKISKKFSKLCVFKEHPSPMAVNAPEYLRYLTPRLQIFSKTFEHALSDTSPIATQPEEIKLQLKLHQQVLLNSLIETEKSAAGTQISTTRHLVLQFGIIADRVGAGKSLVCLALAASKHEIPTQRQIIDYFQSTRYYIIRDIPAPESTPTCSLIIVPHILVKQWYDYIRQQTTLKVLMLRYTRDIDMTDLIRRITAADITLVTNTMFKQFEERADVRAFHWKRIFIDEADTIDIKKLTDFNLQASFVWFITASYMNILYPTGVISYPRESDYSIIRNSLCPAAATAFIANPGSVLSIDGCKSQFMKNLVSIADPLRWRLVHRNDDDFISRSFALPALNKHIVQCTLPPELRLVSELMSPDIQALLNANDLAAVYRALGVQPRDQESIISAVTRHFTRELNNARLKLEYKTHIEYVDEEAKTTALEKIRAEIGHLEARIEALEERIRTYRNDICCICMCEYKAPVMGTCCGTIWCFECLQTCLAHKPACPNCRTRDPGIQWLVSKDDVSGGPLPLLPSQQLQRHQTKLDAFLALCNSSSGSAATQPRNILVFSDHDNTFGPLRELCDKEGITWATLAGNPDVISSIVDRYERGEIHVLFLNAQHRGTGINLTCTTHVVIYHKMNAATEKQVIGRAYRMGRTEPLEVVYLCNPDEL